MIPKQLQNPEFRFVLLGKWNMWKAKGKGTKYFGGQEYPQIEKKVWKPVGKAPFEEEWEKKDYNWDHPKVQENLQKGNNIGIIGGHGGLVILDIDDPILAKQLEGELNTFTIKTGSGGRHFYFIVK